MEGSTRRSHSFYVLPPDSLAPCSLGQDLIHATLLRVTQLQPPQLSSRLIRSVRAVIDLILVNPIHHLGLSLSSYRITFIGRRRRLNRSHNRRSHISPNNISPNNINNSTPNNINNSTPNNNNIIPSKLPRTQLRQPQPRNPPPQQPTQHQPLTTHRHSDPLTQRLDHRPPLLTVSVHQPVAGLAEPPHLPMPLLLSVTHHLGHSSDVPLTLGQIPSLRRQSLPIQSARQRQRSRLNPHLTHAPLDIKPSSLFSVSHHLLSEQLNQSNPLASSDTPVRRAPGLTRLPALNAPSHLTRTKGDQVVVLLQEAHGLIVGEVVSADQLRLALGSGVGAHG